MARLDIERQNKLEPKRVSFAKEQIENMGFDVEVLKTEIRFLYNGNTIKFFPYSGWASGKGIKPCRGLKNLLNQIK